jgi:hypothetical protein
VFLDERSRAIESRGAGRVEVLAGASVAREK